MGKKKTFREAFLTSVPVMAGYLLIGFGFGILLRGAGYGLIWALAMSILIYAGSMQFVGVSLLTAPAGLLTAALTTLMINARHLFYGLSMIEKYRGAGKWKPYLIFSLTDETYALLSVDSRRGEDRHVYYFLVSLLNQCYWVLGTALGSLAGAALPFETRGIEFSMTALFVAAYTEQWVSGKNRLPAVIGILVTLLGRILFGRDAFLIPSMLGIVLLLLVFRKRIEKEGTV